MYSVKLFRKILTTTFIYIYVIGITIRFISISSIIIIFFFFFQRDPNKGSDDLVIMAKFNYDRILIYGYTLIYPSEM